MTFWQENRTMTSQQAIGSVDYLTFVTAGAVVMTVFNGAIGGGVELLFDRETGLLARLLAAPVQRLSIVTSRFAYVVGLSSAQSLLIVAAAYAFGVRYRTGLLGVAASLLIGVLFGAGITTLSITLALRLRNHEQFFTITSFVGLPVLFLSTALVPLEAMPWWMRPLARWNPMSYATDATRSLVVEHWHLGLVATMAGLLLLFDLVTLLIASAALRRSLT